MCGLPPNFFEARVPNWNTFQPITINLIVVTVRKGLQFGGRSSAVQFLPFEKKPATSAIGNATTARAMAAAMRNHRMTYLPSRGFDIILETYSFTVSTTSASCLSKK